MEMRTRVRISNTIKNRKNACKPTIYKCFLINLPMHSIDRFWKSFFLMGLFLAMGVSIVASSYTYYSYSLALNASLYKKQASSTTVLAFEGESAPSGDSGGSAPSGDSGSYSGDSTTSGGSYPSGDPSSYPSGDAGSYTGGSYPEGGTYTSTGSTTTSGGTSTAPEGSTTTSSSTYDASTGATTTTTTYTDPTTGETHTSSSTSQYDPSSGQTTVSSSYVDPSTGETVSHSYTYAATTTADPTTGGSVTTYEYVDAKTGETQTTTTYNHYDKETGQTTTKYDYVDPATNERKEYEYAYKVESDPVSRTSTTTYEYVDPTTGQTHTTQYAYDPAQGTYVYKTETDRGTIEYNPKETGSAVYDRTTGAYTGTSTEGNTWSYNQITGEYNVIHEDGTIEQGIYTGPSGQKEGELVVDSTTGRAYTYDPHSWVEKKFEDIVAYKEQQGQVLSDEEKEQMRSELESHSKYYETASKNAYAGAVAKGLPVGDVESELDTEVVKGQGIGAVKDLPITDYYKRMEEHMGRPLLEGEKTSAYARYEEWKEETSGEIIGRQDYFEENYEKMKEFYEKKAIPEQRQFKEEEYNLILPWRQEYEERVATGENKGELEREYYDRFKEQFKDREGWFEPPKLDPTATIAMKTFDEFEERIARLNEQGIALDSDNPLAVSLRTQMESRFKDVAIDAAQEHILFVEGQCQGQTGGSEDACGEQVKTMRQVFDQCGGMSGDSASACYGVVERVARLDCTGMGDSGSCAGEYKRIEEKIELVKDPQTRPIVLHETEIAAEDQLAQDIYTEWRSCQSSGGSDCDGKSGERVRTELAGHFEKWDGTWSAMDKEEQKAYKEELSKEREAYVEAVHAKLDEAGVPEDLQTRFEQQEETRLDLMDQLVEVIEEKGGDTTELEFYRQTYSDFIDSAQGNAAEGEYKDMAGDLHNSNECFELFLEEARAEASSLS